MYKLFIKSLHEWNATKDALSKLQGAYIFVAVVAMVGAGLVSLLNYSAGQLAVNISFLALAAFFMNAIAWALLRGLLLFKLDETAPQPPKRKLTK